MKSLRSALIVGGSSDQLNSNSILRQFVADGMQAAFPDATVIETGPEQARDIADSLKPDLVLIFGSIMIDAVDHTPLVETARGHGARIAFWLHDDPYEFDASFRALPMADVIFTNEIACLDFYPPSVEVRHLPLGASITRHHRPVADRTGPDLFFCGHIYPNRLQVLATLARIFPDAGRSVVFCGSSDMPIDSALWTPLRLSNAALADFNATSLSVLNIGREYDLANFRFNVRPATPGPRTFEAAMSGAAQIVFGAGSEIEAYFEPESECLIATTVSEIIDHVARLRREPDRSVAIGKAAQRRAESEHSYSERARRLVSLI